MAQIFIQLWADAATMRHSRSLGGKGQKVVFTLGVGRRCVTCEQRLNNRSTELARLDGCNFGGQVWVKSCGRLAVLISSAVVTKVGYLNKKKRLTTSISSIAKD